VASYLAILFALLIAGMILYYQVADGQVRRRYVDSVGYNLTQLSYAFEEQIRTVSLYADVLARNQDAQLLATAKDISDSDLVQKTRFGILPTMEEIAAENRSIAGIRLIHGNDRIFDIYDSIYYDPAIRSGEWET
jgi:hypothetical protein